jgi:hypothetical protein
MQVSQAVCKCLQLYVDVSNYMQMSPIVFRYLKVYARV